jgi:hypothetical protein
MAVEEGAGFFLGAYASKMFSEILTNGHSASSELYERQHEGWNDFHGFTKVITTTRVYLLSKLEILLQQ